MEAFQASNFRFKQISYGLYEKSRDFYKKYLINFGKYIKSKTIAIIAETIVSKPNWLIELNSEKRRGINVTIIISVVLITAFPVTLSDLSMASFLLKPLRILNLKDVIKWIESSTINPNIMAKINAFDKLK